MDLENIYWTNQDPNCSVLTFWPTTEFVWVNNRLRVFVPVFDEHISYRGIHKYGSTLCPDYVYLKVCFEQGLAGSLLTTMFHVNNLNSWAMLLQIRACQCHYFRWSQFWTQRVEKAFMMFRYFSPLPFVSNNSSSTTPEHFANHKRQERQPQQIPTYDKQEMAVICLKTFL